MKNSLKILKGQSETVIFAILDNTNVHNFTLY